jgi:large subunit ribosomal protein L29
MKGKVWQGIRNLADVELEVKLRETEEELFRVKFRHSSTPVKNPLVLRNLKRTVAKIKTLMHERKTTKASA